MRIALQTITGSTYTSDDLGDVEYDQANEYIEDLLNAGHEYVPLESNGRMKFISLAHVVWMQAVK